MFVALGCVSTPEEGNGPTTSSDVVATLGGEPITADELEAAIGPKLVKLRQQIYQTKVEGIKQIAYDRLVAAAAAAAGVEIEQYLADNLDNKMEEPAKEQVDSVLKQYRSRLPGDDEAARQEVLKFLNSRQRQSLENQLKEKLFASAELVTLIEPPRFDMKVAAYNPSRGPEDAPVTLYEFTDFQCPYCARVQPTVEQVYQHYEGKLRHVFKHLPLAMHSQAKLAAEASMCAADQGGFWDLRTWMFDNQRSLNKDSILAQVGELGLDKEKFASCLDQGVHRAEVEADMAEASAAGITGTPGFVINGRFFSGARPYDAFAEIIDDELKRAGVSLPEATPEPEPEAAEQTE